jgi:hypothetical protein
MSVYHSAGLTLARRKPRARLVLGPNTMRWSTAGVELLDSRQLDVAALPSWCVIPCSRAQPAIDAAAAFRGR